MVVPMGACASKFCTGSIFPLVEIRLRMVERSAVATRTGILSSRDINDASRMTAAIIPTAQMIQGRREKKPLLLTVAAILQFVLDNLSLAAIAAVKSDYLFRCRSLPKNRKSLLSLDDAPGAGYNGGMPNRQRYTIEHAEAG